MYSIKPGLSKNMHLPTLKLYHIDPPKMRCPLKTMSRTGNNEKKSQHFLNILQFAQLMYCNLRF